MEHKKPTSKKLSKKTKQPPVTRIPDDTCFSNTQLQLFQNFFATSDDERRYSNTVELWDATPKYHISRRRQAAMRQGVFLPTVEYQFMHRGRPFTVRIDPARVRVNGEFVEFYPAVSEELVEDALRKVAADQQLGLGYMDATRSGVRFTIHMLRKELAARGHTRSYSQIHESLMILSGCHVVITSKDSEEIVSSGILNSLAGVTRARLEQDPKASWYADFCPLVTHGIRTLSYRQFDYHKMMGHSTQLARWFYKRLCHVFTQASHINPYGPIKLSTIERDSGLLDDNRRSKIAKRVRDVLDELVKRSVLSRYTENIDRGARNSIVDIEYVLYPHTDFIKEVKAANARAKKHRDIVAG